MKRPIPIYITEYCITHNPNTISVISDNISYEETDINIVGKFVAHHVPHNAKEIFLSGERALIGYSSLIPTTSAIIKDVRENKVEWLTSPLKDKREFAEWLLKEGLL